jgi:hypothetical protein
MLRKTLFLTVAALLVTLAMSSRAQAWGFYHYGYHYGGYGGYGGAYHIGPAGGVYRAGYPYGGYGGYGGLGFAGYHYGGYGDFHYGYVRRW